MTGWNDEAVVDRQAGDPGVTEPSLHAGADVGIDVLEAASDAREPAGGKAGEAGPDGRDQATHPFTCR